MGRRWFLKPFRNVFQPCAEATRTLRKEIICAAGDKAATGEEKKSRSKNHLDAVFTVSPNRQKRGARFPTTLPTQGPE